MKSRDSKIIVKETKKISHLAQLLQSIEWVQIESYQLGMRKLAPDGIAVAFLKSKSEDETATRITVRFGREVLAEMGWTMEDRIEVLYDPDYLMRFLFTKTERGRKITLEREGGVGSISFPWKHKSIPLDVMRGRPVKFEIYEGYLSFCADNENFLA